MQPSPAWRETCWRSSTAREGSGQGGESAAAPSPTSVRSRGLGEHCDSPAAPGGVRHQTGGLSASQLSFSASREDPLYTSDALEGLDSAFLAKVVKGAWSPLSRALHDADQFIELERFSHDGSGVNRLVRRVRGRDYHDWNRC